MKQIRRNQLFGWSLDRGLDIDETVAPGFLSFLIRAHPLRRHAIFAAISVKEAISANDIAFLKDAKERDIIVSVYGSCPDGYLGMLDRLTVGPLERSLYSEIHSWFKERNAKSKAIRQINGAINSEMLVALDTLSHPVAFGSPIIRSLGSELDAQMLNYAIAIVQQTCTALPEEQLKQSFSSSQRLGDWLKKVLLRHFDHAPYPLPNLHENFAPICKGPQFDSYGRTFRNCLSTKVLPAAAGLNAYLFAREQNAIVELRRIGSTGAGSWLMTAAYKQRNYPPTLNEYSAIAAMLAISGIQSLAFAEPTPRKLMQRLGHFEFDIDELRLEMEAA